MSKDFLMRYRCIVCHRPYVAREGHTYPRHGRVQTPEGWEFCEMSFQVIPAYAKKKPPYVPPELEAIFKAAQDG